MLGKMFKAGLLNLTQGNLKNPVTKQAMIRALIERAVAQSLVIKITYIDADQNTTERDIEPLEWDATLVSGRCRMKKDHRRFSFSGIESAQWTGEVFEPLDNSLIEKGNKERAKAKAQ